MLDSDISEENAALFVDLLQLLKRLELRTISTHDPGLGALTWGFTALPESGSIVVPGQTAEDAPWVLHQYRLEGGKLQKLRQVKLPCEHKYTHNILGVMVEGQELLAVACLYCRDIKLMNLETRETQVAYSSEKKPYRLCHGEAGRMWVYCRGDDTVRELNCSSKTFTETGRSVNPTGHVYNMCYLPAPHRALVLCCHDWLEAVSCETGQQLWRLDDVDGERIDPQGVTLHPEFQLLLVADWSNNRILVLDPETWSPLQTFPSHYPRAFWWSRGRLLLLQSALLAERCISHLRLVDPEKGESLIDSMNCETHSILLHCTFCFEDLSEISGE